MRAVTPGFRLGGLDEAVEAFQNPVGDLALEPAEHTIPMVHDGVDVMDASPYTGPAAGSFLRESSLEPDGIKVPKWKFIHAKDKEDSSCRLQHMD